MNRSVPAVLVLLACVGASRGQNACLNYTGFVASGGLDLWGITAGRLNDDTLLDMAVSNHLTADISLFFGNGDGSFQAAVTLPVDPYPVDIVAADLDHDGREDLVTARGGGAQVLLNLGNGTFSAPVTYETPPVDTWILMVRDLDGDEVLDLLVPHGAGGGGLAILLGNGDGTFQAAVSYPTDVAPTSLDVADFNEDGDLDVLYTHLSGLAEVTHFWSVLWGNGSGTFGPPTHVVHTHTSIFASAIDVDENGDVDVVVSNSYPPPDSLAFCMGDGAGGFAPAVSFYGGISPSIVQAADMDLDGFIDLVVADYANNSVRVFPGNGAGAFGAPGYSLAAVDPVDLAVGRFNADSYPDIVISDSQGAYVGVVLSCLVAGVEDVARAHAITVGPNPADDQLGISLGEQVAGSVEIRDASARTVHQAPISGGSVIIRTADFAEGSYIAALRDAGGRIVGHARFEVVHGH